MRRKWKLVAFIAMCLGPFGAAFGTPNITSISPSSGPVTTSVTIRGTGLGGTPGTVTFFNNQTESATSWTINTFGTTTIVAAVPTGATTGNVYVTTAGNVNSNSLPFTVTPTINPIGGLSPAVGPVGLPVTITGNNFGSTQGSSNVTFNGTPAPTPALSWGSGSITVIVPIGATTGNVVVTVGGYPSNGVSFSVQGAPLIYAARTDMAETCTGIPQEILTGPQGCSGASTGHQGAILSYLGRPTDTPPAAGTTSSGNNLNGLASYLYATNSSETSISHSITDPDFGTTMYRATDYSLNSNQNCTNATGGSQSTLGVSFSIGSGGGPGTWAVDDSRILILNSDAVSQLLAFNPSTGAVTSTPVCGAGITGSGGSALSQVSPHVMYRFNPDKENTIPFSSSTGTFVTPETVAQTGSTATALLLAVNSNFVQLSPVTHTPNSGTTTWCGQTSGACFTTTTVPLNSANTPYANTIYKGVINDSGAPSTWSVSWSLLFNFNYVSGQGAPYFPTGAATCMPANYNANYNGQFTPASDDSNITVLLSDTGQVNKPGGSCSGESSGNCTGPVWVVSWTSGEGCRVLNSWTNTIAGDWGPTGQPVIGQEYYVTGTITGTFATTNETLTQSVSGATSQLNATGSIQPVSGSSDYQFVPSTSSPTSILMGMIYGTADSSHEWCGGMSGACITPQSGNFIPIHPPFYFPDVLHDQNQEPNPLSTGISWVQQGNAKITQVAYNASTHRTTITMTGGSPVYSAASTGAQQLLFYNLAGAHDQYLNCTSQNNCPPFNVAVSTSGNTIVISDTQGGSSNYSDTESQSGCGNSGPTYCPLFAPSGQGTNGGNATVGYGFQSNPNEWQVQTLAIETCTAPSCQGHAAGGYINSYRAKQYSAHAITNPSTPCVDSSGSGGNPLPSDPPYAGPLSPCPNNGTLSLLPVPVTDDQHGTYNNRGLSDLAPVPLVTTLVCGQGGGAGSIPCEYDQNLGSPYVAYAYQSVWDSEIIAIQNWLTQGSNGASCTYNPPNSYPSGCVYRLGHTFNTNNSWNFNAQNAIGDLDASGQWVAFPSDLDLTLGCTDGTANCWDSYTATQPNAAVSGATVQTDGSGNITITMPNNFCPTSGTQYYYQNFTTYPIQCGSRAGTVAMSGFVTATWLNGATIQLTGNVSNAWGCTTSGASAGNCTAFTGTLVGGGAPTNYGPETEPSGTQQANPNGCGSGTPCQRFDIWVAHVTTAHQ